MSEEFNFTFDPEAAPTYPVYSGVLRYCTPVIGFDGGDLKQGVVLDTARSSTPWDPPDSALVAWADGSGIFIVPYSCLYVDLTNETGCTHLLWWALSVVPLLQFPEEEQQIISSNLKRLAYGDIYAHENQLSFRNYVLTLKKALSETVAPSDQAC